MATVATVAKTRCPGRRGAAALASLAMVPRRRARQSLALAGALTVVAFVGACGDSRAVSPAGLDPAVVAGSDAPTRTRVADVEVVGRLLRQRQQTVDVAELAFGRTANPELLRLAGAILTDAGPELDTLQDLLWRWQADATGADHHQKAEVMPHVCSFDGDELDALSAARGAEFDSRFSALLQRHETSATLAARRARREALGSDAIGALTRAEADQRTVLAMVTATSPAASAAPAGSAGLEGSAGSDSPASAGSPANGGHAAGVGE